MHFFIPETDDIFGKFLANAFGQTICTVDAGYFSNICVLSEVFVSFFRI